MIFASVTVAYYTVSDLFPDSPTYQDLDSISDERKMEMQRKYPSAENFEVDFGVEIDGEFEAVLNFTHNDTVVHQSKWIV